jgi:hypothetical protein
MSRMSASWSLERWRKGMIFMGLFLVGMHHCMHATDHAAGAIAATFAAERRPRPSRA